MNIADLASESTGKEYTETLITYIDILGFRQKVENNSCDQIYDSLKHFYQVTGEDDNLKRVINLNVITFSDTSLRLYKIRKLPFGLLLFEIMNMWIGRDDACLPLTQGEGTWGQSYIIHFTHMEKGMGQTQ